MTSSSDKATSSCTVSTAVAPSLRSLVQAGISNRNDFPIRPSSMALLIIDIQTFLTQIDDTSREYKHAVGFPRMIENTKRVLDAVRAIRRNRDGCGSEVIFTYLEALTDNSRDVSLDYKLSGPLLSQLPNPSSPAKFLPSLKPIPGQDICLPKTSCSVFQSTNLDYILRNLCIEQLVICGQLTDQCVESTVRDAADLGYLVSVVEDACGAESEECHRKGLHGMKGFGRILCTDQVLKEIGIFNDDIGKEVTIGSDDLLKSHESNQTDPVVSSQRAITIPSPSPSEYFGNKEPGYQAAVLRSLRAAGVKFLRYAIVDAFNTIRCKTVPLKHTISLLPNRNASNISTNKPSPMDNPVSIAEICFAGLLSIADVPAPSSNLTARNILVLHPDFSSLRVLPYAPQTAMIMCTGHDQQTKQLSPLCTRGLLERVLHAAREEMGLEFCVGAELEFILFRAGNNDGRPEPVDCSTFANAHTLNEQEEFIGVLYDQLQQQDIPVEMVHSESASGQLEVVITYSSNVVQLADDVVLARETIAACAKRFGMKALFLPKTSMMEAGNGLHLHFSFKELGGSNSNENSFSDPMQPSGISVKGESFIEGILHHLPSLLSFTLPTINSFRRMGPGCWTGNSVEWSIEDKEVPIRVCVDLNTGTATNVEFKLSDASSNIYLELAMILSTGMEGMRFGRKLRPMRRDVDIFSSIEDECNIARSELLPTSLQESLGLLRSNNLLLSVMGPELSTAYMAVRQAEIELGTNETLENEVVCAFKKA